MVSLFQNFHNKHFLLLPEAPPAFSLLHCIRNSGCLPFRRGEVPAIVSAAISLPPLAMFVPCCLCQFFCFCLQQPVQRFSTLPRTNSFICPLIFSSFSCTIISGKVCCLFSECSPLTPFCQDCKPCPFLSLFQFAQFIVPLSILKHFFANSKWGS